MEKENIVKIDLSNCAELELLEQSYYKSEADSSIIAFMLNNNYSIASESFKEYHSRFVEQHSIMTILRNKIYLAYTPEDVRAKAYHYEIDFEGKAILVKIH